MCGKWYFLMALCLGILLSACKHDAGGVKYVFYFIGDGMGVNQVTGTEMFLAERDGRIGADSLCCSSFPVRNYISTYSAQNAVTCSSAAGTALACGLKTKNGSVGISPTGDAPLVSIAEKAHEAGIPVGIITSVGMNHATPAAFYAHQPSRNMYFEIGRDAVNRGFDLYCGATVLHSRVGRDSADLYTLFERAGYTIARGLEAFRQKSNGASKLLVVQEKNEENFPYAIDRQAGNMTLADVTRGAVDFLQRRGEGFFLMVEGGAIDFACHVNDGATVFHEILDFDAAVQVAFDFYRQHPDETLIVVTADHETGGIVLGDGPYKLNLKVLTNQKVSLAELTRKMKQARQETGNKVSWEVIQTILKENLEFWKNVALSEEENEMLEDCYERSFTGKNVKLVESLYAEDEPLAVLAVKLLNRKAHLSWASGGHSAGAVPVYVLGKGAELFTGHLDNTDIPKLISRVAGYGL